MENKIKWSSFKEMPKGMKILVVLLFIGIFLSLRNIVVNINEPVFIFGWQFGQPFAVFVHLIILGVAIFTLLGIYLKKWRKIILIVRGLFLINYIPSFIYIVKLSASDIMSFSGRDMTSISFEAIEKAGNTVKILVIIGMLIGLIFNMVIWIYVYRSKKYFTNESFSNNFELDSDNKNDNQLLN